MVTRNFYKCFISSPGDCSSERSTCLKVINDLNNTIGKILDVNLETFMWESDVLPDMGRNGQEIIDDYIQQSEYDVFIGIMKNRFGHPTKRAGSGTEHEFNDALQRKKDSKLPKILFFFGKDEIDIDDPDITNIIAQRQKVKEFKSKIGGNGLYIDFTDISRFEVLLEEKLTLFIKEITQVVDSKKKLQENDVILGKLKSDLENSLKVYNEISPVWIEPIISSKQEIPNNPTKNQENRIPIKDIIRKPINLIIKAPSEFGLTSLAHHLKLEAWKEGKLFLYIDAKSTKKHKIVKDIIQVAKSSYDKEVNEIDCIILDSVYLEENGVMAMIKNLCDNYTCPIIILNTTDNKFFTKSTEDEKVEIRRHFDQYYLLPLPKNEIRKIVVSYSKTKQFYEDCDDILTKITSDLESLNMHRTPKNCISILRAASKIGSEHNAINRTKLLETILSSIFDDYEIPTYYDKKPDQKDCSFIIGYFCEKLVNNNRFEFTESYFKDELSAFCKISLIDVNINYLFNILVDNSVLCKNNEMLFYFKSSYWVFYFIAQRMNLNKEFLEFVYSNKKYIDYPEIMEFYTGIDRNKYDALEVLNKDIIETLQAVRTKVNLPERINPYVHISWNPDMEVIKKEQTKISENVISSGLPDEIKDKYDDKHYNQIRPYHQVINSVIRDYSFQVLMQQISASSTALRNSDFVEISKRKELLDSLFEAWNEFNKLLIILIPLLAEKGNVAFDGTAFYLDEDDFDIPDIEQKKLAVLLAVPTNIVKFFKKDLFSLKMGPLLIEKAKTTGNSLIKHEIMLMLVAERPKDWNLTIDQYIISLDKNSFYLSDILRVLQYNKAFQNTEVEDLRKIDFLLNKCLAKHVYKKDNPDMGLINRARKEIK
ncbi:DUF4062 domain-containing protein [Sphingobacterium oryzagri]|uniref:DUF4062 domain-containing protein n=1 Tax=Sphingobacterium oryzagri TaxID=3025669 RepID=A0ABY7WL88_9SPHI|nr:DUF4062 domain-containing protein [Sphingobacterium sp. KACC 22765]WDF70371.1 DUF4062 domain-containing protein [Sphingobacterium sp. KACC 22765]